MLQDDIREIEELYALNRRANYERAKREHMEQQNAEIAMEARLRLEAGRKRANVWRGNFILLAIAVIGNMLAHVVAYLGAR